MVIIMTQETKHTPLPWFASNGTQILKISDNGSGFIIGGEFGEGVDHETEKANVEFIVHACNNFYPLLELCKRAYETFLDDGRGLDLTYDLEEAIKLAENRDGNPNSSKV